MKLIIDSTNNGFTLCCLDEETSETLCFEVNENKESSEVEASSRMLWAVIEYLGVIGSRYDKKRLRINIEHGDKFDCKDKSCEICEVARSCCNATQKVV